MHVIMLHPRVGAPHDTRDATNTAVDDVFIQRGVGSSEGAAQHVIDVFVRKTVHAHVLAAWDHDAAWAILEALDGEHHDLIRSALRFVLIELDVGCAFDLAPWVGGEELGAIAFGQGGQRLHDALYIHSHGIHGTGGDHRFHTEKIPGMGNAVTSQGFGPGTAHTEQVDPLRSSRLRLLEQGRIGRGGNHGFKEQRFMAVNDDVHLVFLEKTHVYTSHNGSGGAEENVGNFRGHHGSAPAIRQRCTRTLLHNIIIVLVNADVGTVHDLHDLPHGSPGHNAMFSPRFQSLCRHPFGKGNFAFNLGVGPLEFLIEIISHFDGFTTLYHDPDAGGDITQFRLILDLESLDIPFDHLPKHIEHAHAMVGVGSRSARHHTGKIAGANGVDGGTANTHARIGVACVEPAGPHETMLAAGRLRTDRAGLHVESSLEGIFLAVGCHLLEHLQGGLTGGGVPIIDFLDFLAFQSNGFQFLFFI